MTAHTSPIITVLDIELLPIEAQVWQLFDQNIGLSQISQDWTLMSFAAKRLDPAAPSVSLRTRKAQTTYMDVSGQANVRDDRELVEALWHVLHESDIIVGHNVRRFDFKKMRARMMLLGLQPHSPCRMIDTLELAKGAASFTSNKLAYLSPALCAVHKTSHKHFPGHELWSECMKGNPKAWAECRSYNILDVLSDEELYLKLRPWATQHLNVAVYQDPDHPACPVCGGHGLTQDGFAFTNVSRYPRYHCGGCGAWSRSRYTVNSKAARKNLLSV